MDYLLMNVKQPKTNQPSYDLIHDTFSGNTLMVIGRYKLSCHSITTTLTVSVILVDASPTIRSRPPQTISKRASKQN